MPHFDETKKYQPKEDGVFFDDGREIELLHFVYGKQDLNDIRGSPERVLAAIDEYARTKKYLMNIGDDKGKSVTDVIAREKPELMVEMGGYVGYSTILFADALRKAGGSRYFTLEGSPEFAAVIASLVDLAGLKDVVQVVVGSCEENVRRLYEAGHLPKIDMMFLDHWKPAYETDLKLCEELGLVRVGTVIAADNVIYPGNPPYLKYVRSSVEEKQKAAKERKRSGKELESEFGSKTTNQYQRRNANAQPNFDAIGNPNLVYESELIDGYEPSGEPDGVEVTRCVGIQGSS